MFSMNKLHTALHIQLKSGNKVRITTDGDCMRPIINNADIVEVSISEKYQIGDIVLVSVQNRLRIHRIIFKDSRGYVTKGDHSYLADNRTGSLILGKAIINLSQNRSLCSNHIRSIFRAKISMCNSKTYRRYLKTKNCFFRVLILYWYRIGDFLLFYI